MKMESISSDLYPLTSLQIGDVQSYLSQAYLYFAHTSNKFLILVDNQSWRVSNYSRSAHIRELLITKCRTSPFRNNKALLRSLSSLDNDNNEATNRWDQLLYAVKAKKWKKTAIYSMMDLGNALHGFIVFEVVWKDVCGINYLNQLQSDTSMAFEVKSMRKWEFHSINQASKSISSWFSDTSLSETKTLQNCLSSLSHKVPSHSPRKKPKTKDEEKIEIESTKYEHTLIKFCFIDCNLPYKFKEIITIDLRLLTLVESGLPFWVIFLQSYPLFCKTYRPWMRPLVKTLYMLISLVTVMIGFYDLYKNVPLLKSTASHLCGPLFNWIEDWEMVSRIRYLGTMLFLQNFEKAVRWLLATYHGVKLIAMMITKRIYEPFEVVMMLISPILGEIGEIVSSVVMPFCSLVADLFRLLISPFEVLFSFIVTIVGLFKPVFTSLWGLFVIPTQTCVQTAKYVASMATEIYEVFEEMIFLIVRNVIELAQLVKTAKTSSGDVSMWNTLWRDLLSKVFRSLRSVINGLVAFLNSCNRHRLSIYNHLRAYTLHISCLLQSNLHGQPHELCPKVRFEDHSENSSEDASSCTNCGGVNNE